MLQPRQPVPLIGAKRGSFRYNRRDVQFDELFEAQSPSDARVLIQAKLAREPAPSELAARARARRDVDTAAPGDDRSRIVTRDAGIPTTPTTVLAVTHDTERAYKDAAAEGLAHKLDGELTRRAEDLEPPPPPAAEQKPKKKRVRNRRKPTVGDPPADL